VIVESRRPEGTPLLRKMAWTVLTGFIAFAGSALLDDVFHVSSADQILLTFITGGVTLIVQYLAEFEQKLRSFEVYERDVLTELGSTIRRSFAGVNEATDLHEEMERSTLNVDVLKQVIRRAGHFTNMTSPLVRRLADGEVERLAGTLQSLAGGHELFYDGEDREFLLGLTRRAQKSILATSWTTKDGPEADFWFTDLAARYLDLQRTALRRGVEVKRVFIFESPELAHTARVQRILAVQRSVGVHYKVLGVGPLPSDGSIADFVIFDGEVSHDTAPVTRRDESGALTTRIVLDQEHVLNRMLRFQELWDLASDA
jgi:hypothetical protein